MLRKIISLTCLLAVSPLMAAEAQALFNGKDLTVRVNDVLMNEATALSATRGAICLQSEGAEIHFRKVELKPLTAQ